MVNVVYTIHGENKRNPNSNCHRDQFLVKITKKNQKERP